MISLPITTETRQNEWQKIQTTASKNNFPLPLTAKLKTQIQHKNLTTKDKHKKWATFTYHSTKIRKITNLFKQTNINIAFKSTNTIQQTAPQNYDTTLYYNKSSIYKLACKTCNKAYIGQTSRRLTQRFHEHIRYIKNDPKSAYTQHILHNVHEYGTITDTMSLLKPIYKTSMLIPYEQLLIQTFHHNGTLVPEQSHGEHNPLFQLAVDTYLMSQPPRPINTSHRLSQNSPN